MGLPYKRIVRPLQQSTLNFNTSPWLVVMCLASGIVGGVVARHMDEFTLNASKPEVAAAPAQAQRAPAGIPGASAPAAQPWVYYNTLGQGTTVNPYSQNQPLHESQPLYDFQAGWKKAEDDKRNREVDKHLKEEKHRKDFGY